MYKVFVYGTLKENQPNGKLLQDHLISKGTVKYKGKGRTEKRYPLVIGSVWNLPCLLYEEGNGKNVLGEIYEVDQEKLDWLDHFEDHPNLYKREIIQVLQIENSQGKKCDSPKREECWCYFYCKYDASYLQLLFHDDYDSYGPHGLRYDEEEALSDTEYT